MMTHPTHLSYHLDPLGLSAWQYLPLVGSTNDIALDWAGGGAPDWALVVADAQTAGRGRADRKWVTKPGSALAFSLVLQPTPAEVTCFARFTALAALGLIQALSCWDLTAALKWPNDILLAGQKVAGVLVEAEWWSDQVEAVVIGLGVNVSAGSVPPAESLRYPATAVEKILGAAVDRWALLAATIRAMQTYRAILTEEAFIGAWNENLAMRGEWVSFQEKDEAAQEVQVLGVDVDGRLILMGKDGTRKPVLTGELLMNG